MVSCDQVIEKLWEYLSSELDGNFADTIRDHIEKCEQCLPEHDARRAYLRLMRNCSTGDVPAELRRRLFKITMTSEGKNDTPPTPSNPGRIRSFFRRIFGRE
ncbi:MAG: zf-HC2 domain-containing protein [Gemmatimonadota bacterium]|jgi:anti-sigma factor (TIGR02949 family)|nr:zf-HC2 domain-containing protein [Gemmatimonadota bacterium]